MEAIDVRNGLYEVFDSVGNRLALTLDGEYVAIQLDPVVSHEPEELTRRLADHVAHIGSERVGLPNPEGASLPELVEALVRFERAHDQRNWPQG